MQYDGAVGSLGAWFIAKLAFVGIILASLVLSLTVSPAVVRPQVFGLAMRFSMIGIVICSVIAFG